MKCIIIGAGNLNTKQITIQKDDFIICADGGYIYAKELKIKPNLIVGDFDSLTEEVKDIEVLKYSPEKNETDTYLAIQEGIKRGYHDFVLYGCLGGRIEHTIANLQIMAKFIKKGASIEIVDDETYIKLLKRHDQVGINANFKGYISLFSLSRFSTLSIKGLKYPLNHATISSHFPLGLDNEATTEDGIIKIHYGLVLLIISKKQVENM